MGINIFVELSDYTNAEWLLSSLSHPVAGLLNFSSVPLGGLLNSSVAWLGNLGLIGGQPQIISSDSMPMYSACSIVILISSAIWYVQA